MLAPGQVKRSVNLGMHAEKVLGFYAPRGHSVFMGSNGVRNAHRECISHIPELALAPIALLASIATPALRSARNATAASSVPSTHRCAHHVRRGNSAKPFQCRRRAWLVRAASTVRRARARAPCVRAVSGARQTAQRARRARKGATAARRPSSHPLRTAAIARQARHKLLKAPRTVMHVVQGSTREPPASRHARLVRRASTAAPALRAASSARAASSRRARLRRSARIAAQATSAPD